MRIVIVLMLMALLALPAAAGSFVDEVTGFLGQPSGQTLMLIHGDTATGAGMAYSYELASPAGWSLSLDVGLIQSNASTGLRVIPGLSIAPPVGGSVRPFVGIAATPDEYGQLRLGGIKTDAAIYGGFRKVF